jgi:predicted nucleic acid-binding protein
LSEDREVAVWTLTRVEMASALRRKEREGGLSRAQVGQALARLEAMALAWTEVEALHLVRERAERLLGAHPLRAADALQLAAALVLVEERPRGWFFVTCDDRLGQAGEAEGFTVAVPLPPKG